MKITKKILDFWENTSSELEYLTKEVIKDKLRAEGKSENDSIFYNIILDGEFPIKVEANTSCHCHPEYEVIMKISKDEIIKKENDIQAEFDKG